MYFTQISVPGLGCQSYAIGCPAAKQMMVVDPKAGYSGLSGYFQGRRHAHHPHHQYAPPLPTMSAATRSFEPQLDADIYINENGVQVEYPHKALNEGDVFELGAAKVQVLHTPGHTPNSVSLLVTDKARSSRTGNDPDRRSALCGGRRPSGSGRCGRSWTSRCKTCSTVSTSNSPTTRTIWKFFPAHGQGSLCGRGMSAKKKLHTRLRTPRQPDAGLSLPLRNSKKT